MLKWAKSKVKRLLGLNIHEPYDYMKVITDIMSYYYVSRGLNYVPYTLRTGLVNIMGHYYVSRGLSYVPYTTYPSIKIERR